MTNSLKNLYLDEMIKDWEVIQRLVRQIKCRFSADVLMRYNRGVMLGIPEDGCLTPHRGLCGVCVANREECRAYMDLKGTIDRHLKNMIDLLESHKFSSIKPMEITTYVDDNGFFDEDWEDD